MSFTTRYIDSVDEYCGNAWSAARCRVATTPRPVHTLDSTIYNDLQVAWSKAFSVGRTQAGAGRQQYVRRGSAGLLHLLAEWL